MNPSSFFNDQGYYLAKGLLPALVCTELREAFLKEIKTYQGELLRQRNVCYEKHRIASSGFMNNPLLDVHNANYDTFEAFNTAIQRIFDQPPLFNLVRQILNATPILIQSMYFESSRGTQVHYDHSFIKIQGEDAHAASMIGIWIALEPIAESAGKFYVYPKSHRIGTSACSDEGNRLFDKYLNVSTQGIDRGDQKEISYVVTGDKILKALIAQEKWDKVSPDMEIGDVLFFSGQILHGSDNPVHFL